MSKKNRRYAGTSDNEIIISYTSEIDVTVVRDS